MPICLNPQQEIHQPKLPTPSGPTLPNSMEETIGCAQPGPNLQSFYRRLSRKSRQPQGVAEQLIREGGFQGDLSLLLNYHWTWSCWKLTLAHNLAPPMHTQTQKRQPQTIDLSAAPYKKPKAITGSIWHWSSLQSLPKSPAQLLAGFKPHQSTIQVATQVAHTKEDPIIDSCWGQLHFQGQPPHSSLDMVVRVGPQS